MPLVHPSAGVNYHGSMQLSRFTSSEGTLLGVLEQLLFKNVAVRVPVPAFPSHLPSAWPAVLRQFWGRRAGSLAFCAGSHRALCVAVPARVKQCSRGGFWGPCTPHSPRATGWEGSLGCPCACCSSPLSQSYSVCKCSRFYGHFMTLLCGTYNFNGWKSN